MAAKADLDSLRRMVGAQTTKDDALLAICLQAAGDWIYDRVYTDRIHRSEVQEAILLLASRLYKRRQSPEGVAGWDEMSGVIRVISRDPDVERLIEQHLAVGKVLGIA